MVQAHPRTTNTQVVVTNGQSNEAVEAAQEFATEAAGNMAGEAAKSLINNEDARGAAAEALSGGLTAIGDASAAGCIKGIFSCISKAKKQQNWSFSHISQQAASPSLQPATKDMISTKLSPTFQHGASWNNCKKIIEKS